MAETGAGGGGGAPSECLAEFLSALMRRQYRPALHYCRLILRYEPNNATAQGFYPLLRQKVKLADGTLPDTVPAERSPNKPAPPSPVGAESSEDEASGSEGTSGSDSEDCASSSASWRRDMTTSEASTASGSVGGRHSSDGGGSPAATGALLLDDNGNALGPGDAENDNVASTSSTQAQSALPAALPGALPAELAKLRAQFAAPPRPRAAVAAPVSRPPVLD